MSIFDQNYKCNSFSTDATSKAKPKITDFISKIQPENTSSRKYNVKKVTNGIVENGKDENAAFFDTNQNNLPYSDSRRNYQTNYGDINNRYRFKSYEYAPARSKSDQYPNEYKFRNDIYPDFSGDSDYSDNQDNCPQSTKYHKFRRSYGGRNKEFSSNEDLDFPRVYDYEGHCSSDDSSLKRSTNNVKSSYVSYGDCTANNCQIGDMKKAWNGPDQLYDRDECVKPYKSIISNSPYRPKLTKYANNNFCPKKPLSNRSCPDNHETIKNKNPMSLRSTYRRNENVPHSGTRLEGHRKQIDKYCSGKMHRSENFVNNNFRCNPKLERSKSIGTRLHEGNNNIEYRNKKSSRGPICSLPQHYRQKQKSELPPSPRKLNIQTHKIQIPNQGEHFCSPRRYNKYRSNIKGDYESSYMDSFQNANNDFNCPTGNHPMTKEKKGPQTCQKYLYNDWNNNEDYNEVIEPNNREFVGEFSGSDCEDDNNDSASTILSNDKMEMYNKPNHRNQTSFSSPKIIPHHNHNIPSNHMYRYHSGNHCHPKTRPGSPPNNTPDLFVPSSLMDNLTNNTANIKLNPPNHSNYNHSHSNNKYHKSKRTHKSKHLESTCKYH